MTSQQEFILSDLEETRKLASLIAGCVLPPMVIALSGTLGAGKTQWTRFFCEAMGVSHDVVTSPTYVLLQLYRGRQYEIYHLDFYRLEDESQVWDLGFDEIQESPVIIVVEWAEKFASTLPSDRLDMHLDIKENGQRVANLTANGTRSSLLLACLSG